jgi:hypothetical protein
MHRVKRLVVLARTVGPDGEPRKLGLGRLVGQVNLHPPEVPDELVTALLDESAAVLVDDMCVQPRQVPLACPALGEVEEAGADSPAARFRMDARLVLEVRETGLTAHPCVRDDATPVDADPGVGVETYFVETPPFAELGPGEADRVLLVEVEAVAGAQERRNVVGVVERGRAVGDLVQSGWPDSNRRLLAPKASTLTRLSYTPELPEV